VSYSPTHVIVGAGQAGCRAAESMRIAGFDGRIVMIGEEDVRPYERPPLSKQMLLEDGFDAKVFLQPDKYFEDQRIELWLGRAASAIDLGAKTVTLTDGRFIRYDKLLIATGSRPRRLGAAAEDAGAHYLRTLHDSLSLREALAPGRRVVLVGGGVIGLEIAAAASERGCDVVVLEAAERLMGRAVSPDISAFFHELHSEQGIVLHYRVSIERIERRGASCLIALDDGRAFEADAVLAGIGIAPNTEIAAAAGIAVDDGILVDAEGRTSAPDVYAAGEVTMHVNARTKRRQRLENWLHADNHGRLVGRNMCGGGELYSDVPWFWTDQYEFGLQVAGTPFADRHVLRGDLEARKFTYFHVDGNRVVGASTVNNAREMRHARKLIESGAPLDLRALADPSCSLKDLVEAPAGLPSAGVHG